MQVTQTNKQTNKSHILKQEIKKRREETIRNVIKINVKGKQNKRKFRSRKPATTKNIPNIKTVNKGEKRREKNKRVKI